MKRVRNRGMLLDWGDTLMRDFPQFSGPMATWPKVEMIEGADEILQLLRNTWQLALVTNAADSTEAEIRAALGRVGLDDLMDQVYCFNKIGHRKPSAEFFTFVIRDLGLDSGRVVMVGDDFEIDIVGANSVGIYGVWLSHNGENRSGVLHRTIHNLWELPRALEEIEQVR